MVRLGEQVPNCTVLCLRADIRHQGRRETVHLTWPRIRDRKLLIFCIPPVNLFHFIRYKCLQCASVGEARTHERLCRQLNYRSIGRGGPAKTVQTFCNIFIRKGKGASMAVQCSVASDNLLLGTWPPPLLGIDIDCSLCWHCWHLGWQGRGTSDGDTNCKNIMLLLLENNKSSDIITEIDRVAHI